MNKRIRQLAEQAELIEIIDDAYQERGNWQSFVEKFAELIVRECARVARSTPYPYSDEYVKQQLGHTWDAAAWEAGHEIVKHFGVEE
jgi:hypothetical protein